MNFPPGLRSRLGKRVVQAAVLGLLSAGTVGAVVAPAMAAGTSSTTAGCYTQWWNTAWSQKCDAPGATLTGYYYSGVACSLQVDPVMKKLRSSGSTTSYSGPDCTFSASDGWISFDTV